MSRPRISITVGHQLHSGWWWLVIAKHGGHYMGYTKTKADAFKEARAKKNALKVASGGQSDVYYS